MIKSMQVGLVGSRGAMETKFICRSDCDIMSGCRHVIGLKKNVLERRFKMAAVFWARKK